MQPLINAFIFTYINAGYDVNFGFSRGIGSLSFAGLSFTVGMLINQYSPEFIPWVGILLTTLLVLVTLMFPKINIQADRLIVENQSELSAPLLKNGFLGKYGLFPVFLFSLIFLFTFHTIINTYLNQITTSLGAANGDFGTSLTIAALSELPAMLGFGYLLKKMKVTVLLKISGFFYALRGLLYLFATSVAMINATQLLQALSFAVLTPAAVYYVNHIMTENDRVKGQTFMVGATTVGSVAGSLLGGWLLDISSVRVMLLAGFLAALLGGVLMFVATREKLADMYSGLRKAKHNE
jgi:PPP family 3-phenylpropionic acid transporter